MRAGVESAVVLDMITIAQSLRPKALRLPRPSRCGILTQEYPLENREKRRSQPAKHVLVRRFLVAPHESLPDEHAG
jgi:hypothetical protein